MALKTAVRFVTSKLEFKTVSQELLKVMVLQWHTIPVFWH